MKLISLILVVLSAFALVVYYRNQILPSTQDSAPLTPYLTPHFRTWLEKNGYASFGFARTDIKGGSYGGKTDDNDVIKHNPVIFIHGNGDKAIGDSTDIYKGFTNTIQYLLSKGYKESELYATTWGPANPLLASQQYHSYVYLNYLRNFVEAVIKYTNATKVDIIAHSMGATLGRKVIKGGTGTDGGSYNLGPSLAKYVDTFLGIAGANWGLSTCYTSAAIPTCGPVNGFFPGTAPGPVGLSKYLQSLNSDSGKEGDYVFSMLSTADEVIQGGGLVWGKYTSKIPGENGFKMYTTLGHMQLKDDTCAEQYQIISKHTVELNFLEK